MNCALSNIFATISGIITIIIIIQISTKNTLNIFFSSTNELWFSIFLHKMSATYYLTGFALEIYLTFRTLACTVIIRLNTFNTVNVANTKCEQINLLIVNHCHKFYIQLGILYLGENGENMRQ